MQLLYQKNTIFTVREKSFLSKDLETFETINQETINFFCQIPVPKYLWVSI